jgi:S-methylmethionine-dependent homocysteine/selenocysteine methylase
VNASEPQWRLDRDSFLSEGGLETTLIFHDGFDLPLFAAFTLLDSDEGRAALHAYYRRYAEIGRAHGVPVILDTPTWRASADWGAQLGYSSADLDRIQHDAVTLLQELRDDSSLGGEPVLISGAVGPQGDGYNPEQLSSPEAAEDYHAPQIAALAAAGADLVTVLTMTHVGEAVGVVRAARQAGIPAVVSFTVETDGRLPSGDALGAAIQEVDAATEGGAAHFMVNCAHPTHFETVLREAADEAWLERVAGIRANASTMSHAELDEAEELDDGDPDDLAVRYGQLAAMLPNLRIVGGCCGTDHRHVAAVGRQVHAPR